MSTVAPSTEFEVTGSNAAALFTAKFYRGDGMTLIAMNWKDGKPLMISSASPSSTRSLMDKNSSL
jgi:hypothetical protein